jgi:3-methyladenine DNA glycosylase AlkD
LEKITSRFEIANRVGKAVSGYQPGNPGALAFEIETSILRSKVRFPLLESAAKQLFDAVQPRDRVSFAREIMQLHTIGGNVIAGIFLQARLKNNFRESLDRAVEFIILGNEWYVCDIIGERVIGYALLTDPENTIPVLHEFAGHENKWIVRSVGVATHYAVKKGLRKNNAAAMFRLLLSLAAVNEFHTQKGIGWGAKTIAKFHPDIIHDHDSELEKNTAIRPWFRKKIQMGLSRSSKYASKYPG